MTSNSINWDIDLPADPEEDYQAFVRGLRRRQGFGLFFVQSSPAEGNKLIKKIKQDISQKKIDEIRLKNPINNLYEIVNNLPNRDVIDILFISGLEHSLYEYEERKITQGWNSQEKYTYSWKGVPPILSHLNQQRERFRDDFNICFVFLIPSYILKYFIHRAPDFFDWRSGFFELPTDSELIDQKCDQIREEDYYIYKNLTPDERRVKFLEFQDLLENKSLPSETQADLQYKLGLLLAAEQKYEAAINSWDKALEIKPDDHDTWNNRGLALDDLERYEEAINSYDKALEIKPDLHQAWYNRGVALKNLERYEEAINSYDKALEIKPDLHEAWNSRGIALGKLGRYEEAIDSFDKALELQPDYYLAWGNKGIALRNLERYEEAINSYDKALEIQPDYYYAWFYKGQALMKLRRFKQGYAALQKAREINPDLYQAQNEQNIKIILTRIGWYKFTEFVKRSRKRLGLSRE